METLLYNELIDSGLYSCGFSMKHKTDSTKSKYNYTRLFYDYGDMKYGLTMKFRSFVDKESVTANAVDRILQQGKSVRWQIPVGKFLVSKFVRNEDLGQMIISEEGNFVLKGSPTRTTLFPSGDFLPVMFSWANKIYIMRKTENDYSVLPVLWVSPFRFPNEPPLTGGDMTFVGRLNKDPKIITATDGWITSSLSFTEDGSPI